MFKTPILFLIFNRPEVTQKVFEEIKKQKPKYLFVAADGPRPNFEEDIEKCKVCREIVLNNIDWDCEVKTLFRNENLGCGRAVSEAITWFFNNVDYGIILEDDCLPDLSFFNYCQELLKMYESDKRIYSITGSNGQRGIKRGKSDYYFSRYPGIWGWATWKDRWAKFQLDLSDINLNSTRVSLKKLFRSNEEIEYHISTFNEIKNNKVDTWDYQWKYVVFKNGGLCATPNVNLISNIGFGEGATHTHDNNHWRANLASYSISDSIIHPQRIAVNSKADEYISRLIFQKNKTRISTRVKRRIINTLKWFKSFIK